MMKKTYHKPQILFEDITFNTAISACTAQSSTDCQPQMVDGETITPTEMEGQEMIFFVEGVVGCQMYAECYHVPGCFDESQLAILS